MKFSGVNSINSLSAIVRPASTVCNLSCYYCYNKLELLSKPERFMKIDILQLTVRNFIMSGAKTVRFLWHGGEPLIAGLDFYRKAVEFQSATLERLANPVTVTNTIQTNGLLLNEENADFLITSKFHFGISIDGPDYIHNQNRYNGVGKGSHQKVLEKIRMLKRLGAECGIVCVVTKKSLPYAEEIFDFFISEGLTNIHFSPYAEINPKTGRIDERSLDAREFGAFIVKIFSKWKALNNPEIKIRIIDNFLQGLLGGRMELCTFARNCARYMLVEVNGDIFICGRNANNPKFYVGNISQLTLIDIITSDAFQGLSKKMPRILEVCEKCKWFGICRGGCSYYKLLASDGFEPNVEYFCEGYKMILTELENWIHAGGVSQR